MRLGSGVRVYSLKQPKLGKEEVLTCAFAVLENSCSHALSLSCRRECSCAPLHFCASVAC